MSFGLVARDGLIASAPCGRRVGEDEEIGMVTPFGSLKRMTRRTGKSLSLGGTDAAPPPSLPIERGPPRSVGGAIVSDGLGIEVGSVGTGDC
jgi:hypothetical protein